MKIGKDGDQPPSGVMMMLKALGIQIDPAMFKTMAEAVTEIRDTLRRVETNSDRYRKALEVIARGELTVDCAAQEYARQILLGEQNPSQLILVKGENNGVDRDRKEVAGRT